jgi:hypothetical protein
MIRWFRRLSALSLFGRIQGIDAPRQPMINLCYIQCELSAGAALCFSKGSPE